MSVWQIYIKLIRADKLSPKTLEKFPDIVYHINNRWRRDDE